MGWQCESVVVGGTLWGEVLGLVWWPECVEGGGGHPGRVDAGRLES